MVLMIIQIKKLIDKNIDNDGNNYNNFSGIKEINLIYEKKRKQDKPPQNEIYNHTLIMVQKWSINKNKKVTSIDIIQVCD